MAKLDVEMAASAEREAVLEQFYIWWPRQSIKDQRTVSRPKLG